jgi:hypothetical protein
VKSSEESQGLLANASAHVDLSDESFSQRLKDVFMCMGRLAKNWIFWCSFVAFVMGTGSGLLCINNIGNVIKSLNGGAEDKTLTFISVAMISVFNGTGRIAMGFSDYSSHKRGYFYFFALLAMAGAQLLTAFVLTATKYVYITTITVGLSYGMMWSISPNY